MWICRNCDARCDATAVVCPECGTVGETIEAADDPPPLAAPPTAESPTEYDLPDLPDPGPTVVECYLGVIPSEASAVADRLRDAGIPVFLSREQSADDPEPLHRVRVPIGELARALAVIDHFHKRRTARP